MQLNHQQQPCLNIFLVKQREFLVTFSCRCICSSNTPYSVLHGCTHPSHTEILLNCWMTSQKTLPLHSTNHFNQLKTSINNFEAFSQHSSQTQTKFTIKFLKSEFQSWSSSSHFFQGKFSQQSSTAACGSVCQGFTLQPAWLCAGDGNTSLRLEKTQNLVLSLRASAGLPVWAAANKPGLEESQWCHGSSSSPTGLLVQHHEFTSWYLATLIW